MQAIIRILIVGLFALNLWWGIAQETIQPMSFTNNHYPYWWERAEPGLHLTWDRLNRMGVWDEYD